MIAYEELIDDGIKVVDINDGKLERGEVNVVRRYC